MDPLAYLRVLRRRWWVWLSVLAFSVGAAVLTLPDPDEVSRGPIATSFTATHTLLQSPDVAQPVNLQLTALFARAGEVPRLAAVSLGRNADDGPQLAADVSIVVDAEVSSLSLSVTGTDGPAAARTANAFGEAVKEFLRAKADTDRDAEAKTLQPRLTQLERQILDRQRQLSSEPLSTPLLEAQIGALSNQYQVTFERLQSLQNQPAASSPLDTLEEAVPIAAPATGSPVPTSTRGRLVLAVVLGLLFGLALALVLDRLDTRLRTREQVEQSTDLPVVAEIPRLSRAQRSRDEVLTAVDPSGGPAEAYRGLRAAVLLIPSRVLVQDGADPVPVDLTTWRAPSVLLVTSPAPADGKTSTVVNLAAALAESGRTVIVLDADFRKPAAHRYLGVARSVGLSDLLGGGVSGGLAPLLHDTSVPGVRLVTSGTSSRTPASMLSQLGSVVAEARQLAEVVLIDAAPMLAANDATDIVPFVDTVIVVTHAGRTAAPQAERTVDLLARLAVPVLGVVVQAAAEATGVGSYEGYGAPGPYTTGPRGPAPSEHEGTQSSAGADTVTPAWVRSRNMFSRPTTENP